MYRSDAKSSNDTCPLIKFADDTALVGLITNDDDTVYLDQINRFVEYCDSNFLKLNVQKTKGMVIDFRKNFTRIPTEVIIKESTVERVSTYKYLGI